MRILVIEDSSPTRELLRDSLEGVGHTVTFASRISSGQKLALSEEFDVIILDVMLPDGSGIDLCREIRAIGVVTPILFLTAKGEVNDRIAGLDAGGDDYLRKPFALAELHARLRALARRQGLAAPALLEGDGLKIDFARRRLEREGAEVPLTAREWDVLELLAARTERVVSREEMLEIVWGDTGSAASESLDVIVSRLRRKIEREGGVLRIRTVRGRGYALEVPQ